MNIFQPPHRQKGFALFLAVLIAGLALTTSLTSARWINTVFPGFFVLANRVVASISLPHWSVVDERHIYQHAITTVNDLSVSSSAEIYQVVRRLPPATPVTYSLRKDGRTLWVTLPTQTFSLRDYFLLFGAYLFTGLVISGIGIGVWVLKPRTSASLALLSVSLSLGTFFLTAVDLYGPHWFFRLHVLSEAFLPAGFVHLALVFPVDRLRHFRKLLLSLPYLVAVTLGIAYEMFLYRPDVYSNIHTLCELYAGVSGLPFLGSILWSAYTTSSHLVRQRIRVIFLGFLGAFAVPSGLTLLSGLSGGDVSVNYSVFTIFLFPLSLGYAIVKHDLFEIDILLKRATYYLSLTALLTLTYVTLLTFLNVTLHTAEIAQSSVFPLVFTLAAVLLLNPLKDHLQRVVDRIFFRLRYDPKRTLEKTSATLASTLRLEEIVSCIWHTLSETMGVRQGGIFLLEPSASSYRAVYTTRAEERRRLSVEHHLIQHIQRHKGRVLSLYDFEEMGKSEADDMIRQGFLRLGIQLVVPLLLKGDLLGFLALGQKESGRFFSADDRDFLSTLANQSALSIGNALAYKEIHELNSGLEQKVEERTQELASANTEIQQSFAQLEKTYRELQRSQEHLVRAEKMAALGRLTAGIAHEMNTPLGASMNSLALLHGLVEEYQQSINDPKVTGSDHQEIATEMAHLVQATRQWVEKASSHIRSLKSHTRDLQRNQEVDFSVLQVIEETRSLLSNRLRLSQSTLTVSCPPTAPIVHGDPGKFGQVLTNLVANAIDAYKATEKGGGEIGIVVAETNDTVELAVSDHGCGIPPEHLEKIFDELFSTKPMGEGTGLGLSISRDIMTNFFGGTLTVVSTAGEGSTFTLRIPRPQSQRSAVEQSASAATAAASVQGGDVISNVTHTA